MTATEDRTGSLARRVEIVVFLCLAVVLICASVSTGDYWLLGIIASPVLGLAAGLAFHEFGHMLCAMLVSVPIRLLSIGIGPLLWRVRIGETHFKLHAVPLSGYVACYPRPLVRPVSMLFVLLGGVLGNAALVGLVTVVVKTKVVSGLALDDLGLIVLVQFFIIIENLVPYWTTTGGVRIGTDGLQLLQVLAGPWRGPTEAGLLYAAKLDGYSGADRVPPRRACVRLIYQILRSDRWADAETRRDFQDAVQRELGRGTLSREETILALDALVTSGLMYRDPAVRTHLDAWSQQALRLGPDIATLRGSRGAVLVELGRYQEGKALLLPFIGAQPGKSFDAFMHCVFLARAEHALGNTAAARAFAATARVNVEAVPQAAFMLSQLDAELATASEQLSIAPQSEAGRRPCTENGLAQ
jgi:Peptidase family M50